MEPLWLERACGRRNWSELRQSRMAWRNMRQDQRRRNAIRHEAITHTTMKTITTVYFYESSSDSSKEYQTLKYSDGTTSCECPGWTRRIDPQGNRSCKHTRDVQSGQARGAVRWYDAHQTDASATTETAPAHKPKRSKPSTPEILAERRNFQFS